MFCIAYTLRRDGVKLPKDRIREGGKRGWLTFARMPAGQPSWTAKLSGPNGGDIFPELMCADVVAISGGILIKGLVSKPGGLPQRQTWYCEPTEAPEGARPPDGRPAAGRRGGGA